VVILAASAGHEPEHKDAERKQPYQREPARHVHVVCALNRQQELYDEYRDVTDHYHQHQSGLIDLAHDRGNDANHDPGENREAHRVPDVTHTADAASRRKKLDLAVFVGVALRGSHVRLRRGVGIAVFHGSAAAALLELLNLGPGDALRVIMVRRNRDSGHDAHYHDDRNYAS